MLHKLRISIAFILLGLLALAMTPLVILRPMHRNNMGDLCIALSQFFKFYWGIKFQIDNAQRLEPDKASVIISNHQDTLDIFFCMRLIRQRTVALVKWEMIYVPIIGVVIMLAGNIMVKRENKDKAKLALERAAKKMLNKNLNVVIFPEGTRNWDQPLPFKLGAFKLAIEAQAPIQPVVYAMHSKTLNTSCLSSGIVNIKCLEPISTEGMSQDDAQALADHCQALIEQETLKLTKQTPGYDGSLG